MSTSSKGRCPANASYNARQNAHWSTRASMSRERICSGAMYAGVPATPLVCTVADIAGGRLPGTTDSSVSAARARPKSVTRTAPSAGTSTFSGLKSRWIRPAAWALASPRPASRNTRKISSTGCPWLSHCRSVCDGTNSIATNT